MEKTNVIVGGSNVNGNIGSCEIKSNSFNKDFWNIQTVAVNSCSGEIISSNVYFDGISILVGVIIILGISFIFKLAFD